MNRISDLTGCELSQAIEILKGQGISYEVRETKDPKSENPQGEKRIIRHTNKENHAILIYCSYGS